MQLLFACDRCQWRFYSFPSGRMIWKCKLNSTCASSRIVRCLLRFIAAYNHSFRVQTQPRTIRNGLLFFFFFIHFSALTLIEFWHLIDSCTVCHPAGLVCHAPRWLVLLSLVGPAGEALLQHRGGRVMGAVRCLNRRALSACRDVRPEGARLASIDTSLTRERTNWRIGRTDAPCHSLLRLAGRLRP